jgi:hypothetical protein
MQNPDGGWGYFPGKQSWLEPTAYAALALHGDPAADRAWKLIGSWQLKDGGWRPTADVQIANWTTALCVSLATLRGEFGDPLQKGVAWLLGSWGVESRWVNRMAVKLGRLEADRDLNLKGWPWKPNTSSWVEPTAHTLVALKQALSHTPAKYQGEIRERVRMGEAQLMDVRCRDGGWNYGSRAVMGGDLPSYPETTALALLGLQGHGDLSRSLERASQMARDQRSHMIIDQQDVRAQVRSPLACTWLRLVLRLHGVKVDLPLGTPLRDVVVTAIDAIGASPSDEVFGTRAISGEKSGATS